jgi:DNA-binding NarL/FixJ family response regulator
MTGGPPVLPPAVAAEPVCYVLIDDEPRYRQAIDVPAGLDLTLVGSYGTVEAFLAIQRRPCHAVVLDLCLNRQTGDRAVLQGVRAIRRLAGQLGHRVVVYTADERPEPVARCVAAGAAAYVSKYDDSPALARAVDEVGRHGSIVSDSLHQALRKLAASCRDIRLSDTLEETLTLLETGMSDREIAGTRQLSVRTIEDHKRKILEIFGTTMEARRQGFAGLSRDLGIQPGDLVNDRAGQRPARGLIARAMPWTRTGRHVPRSGLQVLRAGLNAEHRAAYRFGSKHSGLPLMLTQCDRRSISATCTLPPICSAVWSPRWPPRRHAEPGVLRPALCLARSPARAE